MKRRTFISSALALPATARVQPARGQEPKMSFQYPLAWPDQIPGDGFMIRHGYACENTWYNPGYWHTGEDWYSIEGETAGAEVVSIAAGEVVFAGSDYPGRVVIVQHEVDLFSMYGHLDYALDVAEGDSVEIGDRLGTVLYRSDGAAPSHLHFEVRTFLTTPEVNGDQPRYGFACGFNCPPGPGYWPIDAPEHPSAMGWRNPSHVIARQMLRAGEPVYAEVAVALSAPAQVALWSRPSDRDDARQTAEIELRSGDRFTLRDVSARSPQSMRTSAEAYRVWYEIETGQGSGWVEAMVASDSETGSDGRPSALAMVFLPNPTTS